MNRFYVSNRGSYFVIEDDETGDVLTGPEGRVLCFDLSREAEDHIRDMELERDLAKADGMNDPFDMHTWAKSVCGMGKIARW